MSRMQHRAGFTLVEMLVAMALTLFIMVIITTAFTTSLETFRQLKGIGDMQAQLRSASQRLKADLELDHFDAKKRLSDPRIGTLEGKPVDGFFRIELGSAGALEGFDQDLLESVRAIDHRLHFAIKMRGDRPEHFLSAPVPPPDPPTGRPVSPLLTLPTTFFNQPADARFQPPPAANIYHSPWAEVAYYLVKTGTTNEPGNPLTVAGGTDLFSLMRVQRLVIPRNDQVNGKIDSSLLAAYAGFSCKDDGSGKIYFFTPSDLAQGQRAFGPATATVAASQVLTNVIAFRVQVLRPGDADFTGLGAAGAGVYDTAAGPTPILALKITLRVWDQASMQSRQMTFIQDM